MALKDLENFIIDTKTVSNGMKGMKVEFVELTDHPEYAQLCKMQLDNSLADRFPRDDKRISHDATNYHDARMMKQTSPRYVADEDGFMFIKDEDEAKRVLESLQKLDKDIKLSKYGKQFGEAKATPKK